MPRVYAGTQSWGVVWDAGGTPLAGQSVTIKNRDDGTNATHYSAISGGTSSTGSITTSSQGVLQRWIDAGEYTLTIGASTWDIEAVSGLPGATSEYLPINVKDYGALGDDANDDTAEIQAAISAATARGGGTVFIPAGTYRLSSALSIPNFVNLHGEGQSSILRCTGNHYAVNFNPGNRVSVFGLQVDKTGTAQSSGGAFDFTNAQFNIRIDDIYIGNGLHTTFNIKPSSSSGHFYISRVKWNGSTGCTNGILVGDGTNLVAHVVLRELLCVPATAADMTNFMVVKNNVDTLKANVVELYGATNGVLVGEAASNDVTESFWTDCLIDLVTNVGVDLVKCRGFNWTNGQIQTCGTGVRTDTNAKGVKFLGGTVQNCTSDGGTILGGSDLTFDDVTISDNNTSNGAFGQGLDIISATRLKVLDCTIGNNVLLATGHQKYGLNLSAASSAGFMVKGCTFAGNETAPMQNLNTSASQCIEDNIGTQMPTIASAATVTLPGDAVITISGTTTITSVAASWAGRRVTLISSGALTFTDGSNLKLAGNFVTTADDAITLVCDGSNWWETGRSAN